MGDDKHRGLRRLRPAPARCRCSCMRREVFESGGRVEQGEELSTARRPEWCGRRPGNASSGIVASRFWLRECAVRFATRTVTLTDSSRQAAELELELPVQRASTAEQWRQPVYPGRRADIRQILPSGKMNSIGSKGRESRSRDRHSVSCAPLLPARAGTRGRHFEAIDEFEFSAPSSAAIRNGIASICRPSAEQSAGTEP